MNKVRVLWLVHEASLSGANICLLEHFQILLQTGRFEIFLIVPKAGVLKERVELLGISCFVVPYYSWTRPYLIKPKTNYVTQVKKRFRNLIAIRQIGKIIAMIKPDYVATNTITINIGALVASIAKIKHVWFIHEFGEEDHGFSLPGGMTNAKKWIGKMSDKVVVNSVAMSSFYKNSVHSSKLKLVYNPVLVESKIRHRKPVDQLHFVMLGQIAPGKNQLDAIKGIVNCRNLGLNCRLTIAGPVVNSAYNEIIANYILEHNADNYLKIIGPVQDLSAFFLNADVLLMCSKMEAFGRVTVEALKMGVPVIASDSGASAELIKVGVNGLLYKSGDVASLSQAVIEIKENIDKFDSNTIANLANSMFNASIVEKQLLEVFE